MLLLVLLVISGIYRGMNGKASKIDSALNVLKDLKFTKFMCVFYYYYYYHNPFL